MTLKTLFNLSIIILRNYKKMPLALFCIYACFLNKNFDELEHLLSRTNKNFDVIAITETRITKDVFLTSNLTMNDFSFEFSHTESLAGGTLLHIANHLSCKTRSDLNIYDSNKLKATFTEIINISKSKITIGYFYKHHSMDHYKNTNDLKHFSINYLKNKNLFFYQVTLTSVF